MAVNLSPPTFLHPVDGIRIGCTQAIKSKKRNDLTAIEITPGATVAAIFTQNRYPAPPVEVCRQHLQKSSDNIRGLVINAGVANAGTLDYGFSDAKNSCQLFADLADCQQNQVLPFSTGVIMERLNMERYAIGLEQCFKCLSPDNWLEAAAAITTTDTVIKGASQKVYDAEGNAFTITGIAKGSGMIYPNMATMLAFVATNAAIPAARLRSWQRSIARDTFNAISVDGDTSTNDSFALIATGKGGSCNKETAAKIKFAISEICETLAEAIVRDGEGAKKLITIQAQGAMSVDACRRVAASVACSPLVKTALGAGDANVGRFLMAIGNAGDGFNPRQLSMCINDTPVIRRGGLHPSYNEQRTAAALAGDEIHIFIKLGLTKHTSILKTCDLTHRYIEINADYRS